MLPNETTTAAPDVDADASERAAPEPIADWRFGLRLFRGRYYLNVRFGRERRGFARLQEEGQVRLPVAATAYLSVFSAFFWFFGIVCFVYLLKSIAGINIFAHSTSPLHPLYIYVFE